MFHEVWKENIYRLQPEMLTGGFVVDCGANIGAFSLLALALHPEESVIAIEPDITNAQILWDNAEAAGRGEALVVVQRALTDDWYNGPVAFVGHGPTAYVDHQLTPGDDPQSRPVETAKLSASIPTGEIDFMKVDIEGSEWDVWGRGADAWTVMERVRWFAMEWHAVDFGQLGNFLGRLATTHCFDIIGRPETGGMLWAHRHDL